MVFRASIWLQITVLWGMIPLMGQSVQHLDFPAGTPRGTVNAIEQDSLGYQWLGTSQGLSRYSGYETRNFPLHKHGSQAFANVADILNHRGELFVWEASGELFAYQYESGTFQSLWKQEAIATCFSALDDQTLILGFRQGIRLYDIPSQQASELLLPDLSYIRLIRIHQGQIYVATSRGIRVLEYQAATHEMVEKACLGENLDVLHFAFDSIGRIWIGTENDGLVVMAGEKEINVRLTGNLSGRFAIRNIEFDLDNRALVAIDRCGLFVVNSAFEVVQVFEHDLDTPGSISQNSIYEIYVDPSNVYWLGAREAGVDLIYPQSNLFTNISHVINDPNSLPDNNVRSILKDQNSNIWFGTENGLSKMDTTHTWKHYSQDPRIDHTAILTLGEVPEEGLLLGTYGEGLLVFDPQAERVAPLHFAEEANTSRFVFATHIEREGKEIWIGGNDKPLSHFVNGSLSGRYAVTMVKAIVAAEPDQYFIGSDLGLFEINTRNQSVRKILAAESIAPIYALQFARQNGTVWVGSYAGLFRYELQHQTLTHIQTAANLEIGTVYSIEKDNLNQLWLGAISGLWRYSVTSDLWRRYDEQDGVLMDECGIGASATFRDGSLAFGGPQGAVLFDPYTLQKEPVSSRIFISDFQVNGAAADSSVLKKDINYLDEIELKYDQNSLSFTFEVLSLHGAKKNTFSWQLHGYDLQPIHSQGERQAYYSNLSPGTYWLEVHTANADGVSGWHDLQLKIVIRNPFWATWPAYLGYFVLLAAFIYLFLLVSRARLHQKVGEEKIKFFIDVAHDIRTPVALVRLLVEQLAEKDGKNSTMDLILRNTQNLNEYVSQLIDFQKASQNQLKLIVEEVDLRQMVNRILADLHPLLESKSMKVATTLPRLNIWVDRAKFRRILHNLISNAIKYSHEEGEIHLRVRDEVNTVHIEIEDRGIGIPENQQKDIFERFSRGTNVSNRGIPGSGIGLMLSKKIVELHSGKILLESKEDKGSKFTVVLKKGTAHYEGHQIRVQTDAMEQQQERVSELIHADMLILLVDDNQDLRLTLKAKLEQQYRVIDAANGKEGLLMALEKQPDLIVTDVVMPEMDGKELCRVIKTNLQTRHIPVIMVTALHEVEEKIEGLEMGADAYVEKPFDMAVLQATIQNLLRARQALKQLSGDGHTNDSKPQTPDETFLFQAVQLIKANLENEEFTIDELCKEIGMSRSNFFRKLKDLTGMTPSNLITEIKLQHALELLKTNRDMRIIDVASQSGFQDPKYFSTLFKKHFGKTPRSYVEGL